MSDLDPRNIAMRNAYSPSTRIHKSEEVANKIRDYIIDHKLKPGDRLPTEGELSERFGVSRVSVREATKALGFVGIIDAAPRRGLSLGHVNFDRLSQYLSFHFAMGDHSIEELTETRKIVELGGLHLTAQRMRESPELYTQLDAINRWLRQEWETASIDAWIEMDVRFHCTLLSASGLRILETFNHLVQVFFRRVRVTASRSDWPRGVASHQKIIDTLRDGDVAGARLAMAEHIDFHRHTT